MFLCSPHGAETARRLFVTLLSIAIVPLLSNPASADNPTASLTTISCSADGERTSCPADTSSGVVLTRNLGDDVCLLGNNWGYNASGIWVTDGCSGEFAVGPSALAIAPVIQDRSFNEGWRDAAESHTWGEFDPGNGFLIHRGDLGSLSISGYALLRYLNQMGDDTFTDHNGTVQPVKLRQDFESHRVLVWLAGWFATPKLKYAITFWTVNATDQDALFANIGYEFSDKFQLYGGIFGNPGTRSLQGSHPYWLGNDRVMADEFFRPFFTQGMYVTGQLFPGFWYKASAGNSNSTLGVTASQFDRKLTYGGSIWWMPTTHEFGPRGAYGDFEMHEELATRFGISYVDSPEQRYTDVSIDPQNTTLRLADSTNLFATSALAPGVTITMADYKIASIDMGLKYKGIFAQAEFYSRKLENFVADGVLPVSEVSDTGFYVQAAFFPIPRKLELYTATSQIYGDEDAGFDKSHEYILGMNYYPFDSRNHRLNVQVIDVNRSPVSSTFGYYTGGQDGTTVAVAFSIFF